jgi:hypothetical protein
MTDMGATFGKLAALLVEIDGNEVMKRGVFPGPKPNLIPQQYRYRN